MTAPDAKVIDFETRFEVREGFIQHQIATNPDSELAYEVANAATIPDPKIALVIDHIPEPQGDVVIPRTAFNAILEALDRLRAEVVAYGAGAMSKGTIASRRKTATRAHIVALTQGTDVKTARATLITGRKLRRAIAKVNRGKR